VHTEKSISEIINGIMSPDQWLLSSVVGQSMFIRYMHASQHLAVTNETAAD